MEYYKFDPETFEYLSLVQAQKNPKGGYLIPFCATREVPPETGENEVAVWDGLAWDIEPDYRGKTVWNKTDKADYQIENIGAIPDIYTLIEPQWFEVWENDKWVPDIPVLKQAKLGEINSWADQQLAAITSTYPQAEIQSWDQQRAEAYLIVEGGDGDTLLLDAMAAARGIDRMLLAEKVLEKSHFFESLSGQIFGLRQKWEDQLEQAQTQEAIETIIVGGQG